MQKCLSKIVKFITYCIPSQTTNYYQIRARDEVEGFNLILIGLLTE
jgi:hypothetical protein